MTTNNEDGPNTNWLVLIHQFSQDPGSLRVKIWRRLQSIGAISIKNSMYVLPLNEQTHEDFEWVLRELIAGGADGAILESRFVDGMNDQQIHALFDAARDSDYAALGEEIRTAISEIPKNLIENEENLREARNQLVRLRKKFSEIEIIDFFGANGREATEGLLNAFADRVATDPNASTRGNTDMQTAQLDELKGKVWVTRRNVHVDRIASAWLVRRWIDSSAVFKFISNKKYAPSAREVRFDMFEAEFTHEGDKCTFEVLLSLIALDDPALQCIAEIIHDIDLKDKKYDRDETQGIAILLAGIVASVDDDDQRIERGSALFNDLYRSFQETK